MIDATARKELLRRANAGELAAQVSLAVFHATGEGVVRKDLKRARRWYALAAGRGDEAATLDYALMLLSGEGGPRAEAEGMRWVRKASREGSTGADILLGDRSIPAGPLRSASARKAASHYARAALRGDARGLRQLTDLLAGADARIVAAVRAGIDAGFWSRH